MLTKKKYLFLQTRCGIYVMLKVEIWTICGLSCTNLRSKVYATILGLAT